jgi:hypothetical protein
MAAAKCDVVRLAQIVDRCFDYAMDARLSQSRRTKFLVAGKRLRGSLLNLIAARFNDTASLAAANARLDAVNARLARQKEVIERAATVLKDLATLTAALDKLLATAILFV